MRTMFDRSTGGWALICDDGPARVVGYIDGRWPDAAQIARRVVGDDDGQHGDEPLEELLLDAPD